MLEKAKISKLLAYGSICICVVFLIILGTKKISLAIDLKGMKDGEIILDVKEGQRIKLKAKKARRADVLKGLSEKTGVEIRVQEGVENQPVNVAFKDLSLQDAIKRIVGNNYVLAMRKTDNGFEVVKGNIIAIKDQIKEFAGSFMEDGGLIKMFFMPSDSTPESNAEYIKERHKLLDYLAEKHPNKIVEAQISLKDFVPIKDVLDFLKNSGLKVKTINPGWKDFGGGNDIPDGQSLEEAIPEISKFEEEFINSAIENAMSEKLRNDMQEYYDDFKEKGVMVYGLKVEGKTKDLKGFKDGVGQSRLVDPLWKGNLFNLLEKAHIVEPIPIVLNPFSEPVSELER